MSSLLDAKRITAYKPLVIARLILLGLLVAACGETAAPTPSPSPVALGDRCLVGRWVETKQFSPGNFGLGTGERFTVTGLQGLVVTFAANGTETDDYNDAQPLNGGRPTSASEPARNAQRVHGIS